MKSISQGAQIEKFKIALGLFQVFSSFKMTYEINWPPEVIEWFNQFAVFENLDILKLVAMDCLFKTDYLFSLKFQTLSPLFLVSIVYYLWTNAKSTSSFLCVFFCVCFFVCVFFFVFFLDPRNTISDIFFFFFLLSSFFYFPQDTYARKLALYPRVCMECHMPINPFEETPRERAVEQWIQKHGVCFRLKWFTNRWCRKKLKLRPPTVTDEMFRDAGVTMFPPPDVHVSHWSRKKKNKKNMTAVIPIGVGLPVQTSAEEETKTTAATAATAAKVAWDVEPKKKRKKKPRPILKRKTSLESNFSDNAVIHKYGCPKDASNPYWKPNHQENSIFNFKMRVKLRMVRCLCVTKKDVVLFSAHQLQ